MHADGSSSHHLDTTSRTLRFCVCLCIPEGREGRDLEGWFEWRKNRSKDGGKEGDEGRHASVNTAFIDSVNSLCACCTGRSGMLLGGCCGLTLC